LFSSVECIYDGIWCNIVSSNAQLFIVKYMEWSYSKKKFTAEQHIACTKLKNVMSVEVVYV